MIADKQNDESKHYWLYALRLEHDKYYVGMTAMKNPYARINMHKNFIGARWTMKYKPLEVVEVADIGNVTKEKAEELEHELTLAYMKMYNYKNVRGGRVTYSGYILKIGNIFLRGNWLFDLVTALAFFVLGFYVLTHS